LNLYQQAYDSKLKGHFLANSQNFLQSLIKNQEKAKDLDFKEINIEIDSSVTPKFEKYETFKVSNFNRYVKEEAILLSQTIFQDGLKWRIKVYPNGNRSARGTHISVYIEMVDGHRVVQEKYLYRIELVNAKNPVNSCIRMDTSEFKRGECWGYNKFISIAQLSEGFLVDDSFEIKFSVAPSTFALKCEDQARYIEKLEQQSSQIFDEQKSNSDQASISTNGQKNKDGEDQDQDVSTSSNNQTADKEEPKTKKDSPAVANPAKLQTENDESFQDLPPLVDDESENEDDIDLEENSNSNGQNPNLNHLENQSKFSEIVNANLKSHTDDDDDDEIPPLIQESYDEDDGEEEEEEEEEEEDLSELFPNSHEGFDMVKEIK